MSDPVDSYLDERQKRASTKQHEDIQLWQTWKKTPKPQTLEPLLKRFDPMFGQRVRMWRAPNVQESAFRAHLTGQAIKAFESYDPNRGASLNTHVANRLKKSLRFVHQTQNLAYIPEAKVSLIGPINSAEDELSEQLGRDPTHAEIASHLGLSAKQVKEVRQAQIKDVIGTTFETDPVPRVSPREQEVLSLLRPSLKRDEQKVFDHVFGYGGKMKIESTTELAKKLGKSPSQVSRLKTGIIDKYKRYV